MRGPLCALLLGAAGCFAVSAEDPPETSPIVLTVTRVARSRLDVPASITSVPQDQIQDGNPQVNLSESLNRVPGIVVHTRQDYAQDPQISSRGFGAEATFGVRGVRLLLNGIPLTMPDGQGQTDVFDLSSIGRIEVSPGPFSTLYGNASGGVIQAFTEEPPAQPTLIPSAEVGSFGLQRQGLKFEGRMDRFNYVMDADRFETQGYRSHGEAMRDTFNNQFQLALSGGARLTLGVNADAQPEAKDPMGLTSAQVFANPRQAGTGADTFNTRKSLDHEQAGVVYERPFGSNDQLRLMGYGGHRAVLQFQAVPIAAQNPATSPGGVVDLARGFGGGDARWTHNTAVAGMPLTLTLGASYDDMVDHRKGYNNFLGSETGVEGALRRDERDTAWTTGQYFQAEWTPHPRWTVDGGVRATQVYFHSQDYFMVPGNGDDSGSVHFTSVDPVGGVLFRLLDSVHLYANASQGFQTPTFDELAYQPNGAAGLNLALEPATSLHSEAGIKSNILGRVHADASIFEIDTNHEIVVQSNTGGRSVFQNAGKTERRGAEIHLDGDLGAGFGAFFSWTYLDAWFKESFTECSGSPCSVASTVPSGNQLPAVPRSWLFGEVSWAYKPMGISTAVEALNSDRVYVNDLNSASASPYAVFNWRIVEKLTLGRWTPQVFWRIDNLADRDYIGAVVVADSRGGFFEPAPGRSYVVGASVGYAF